MADAEAEHDEQRELLLEIQHLEEQIARQELHEAGGAELQDLRTELEDLRGLVRLLEQEPAPAEEADGAAEEADGTAEGADGTAEEADGTAEEADGTAEEADGTAEEADQMAQPVSGREDAAAEGAEELQEELDDLVTSETILVGLLAQDAAQESGTGPAPAAAAGAEPEQEATSDGAVEIEEQPAAPVAMAPPARVSVPAPTPSALSRSQKVPKRLLDISSRSQRAPERLPMPEALLYTVLVDRSAGTPLGIDVETCKDHPDWDGRSLFIRGVKAGLLLDWNQGASRPITPGDRVVRVNGVSGDAGKLIRECQQKRPLDITVARPDPRAAQLEQWLGLAPTAPSAPPEQARCTVRKVKELCAALEQEASATGVVRLVRPALETWSFAWGAVALRRIARRSTAQTRVQWACDATVQRLGELLKQDLATWSSPHSVGRSWDLEAVLVSFEALRRMGLQTLEDQRSALEQTVVRIPEAEELSVAALSRILWLEAPLSSAPWRRASCGGSGPGSADAHGTAVAVALGQLQRRSGDLEGDDIARLVPVLRRAAGPGISELILRITRRLHAPTVLSSLSAEELPEVLVCFEELGVLAEAGALVQEVKARKNEFSEPDRHRVKQTLEKAGMTDVCDVGAERKRSGKHLVTTQRFATQQHTKRSRKESTQEDGELCRHDIARVSPDRQGADIDNSSY